jgi:frizzled 5/8
VSVGSERFNLDIFLLPNNNSYLSSFFFCSARWILLAFTWFLSAALKWSNEAITKHSQYFHLAAWLVPTIQSVSVLLKNAIDGDPVAGICYIGTTSTEHLKNYVLAPLFLYLVVGTTFLLAGFVSLFRIRSVIKQQDGIGAGSKADKLEKLMIRIGIFSVLYTVPATIVIGCYLYETAYHDDWMTSLTCPCVVMDGIRQKPLYSVLMLKYFMTLAVGITSGVWIWSGKTLHSWKKLWSRIFGVTEYSATGAGQILIKTRPPIPQPYAQSTMGIVQGSAASHSLLHTPYTQTIGSVASTSHHHHILKQQQLSHV